MYRESERLMADPAVEQGDRTIAEGMVGRYEGLHFENSWAERVHQTSMRVPFCIQRHLIRSVHRSRCCRQAGSR